MAIYSEFCRETWWFSIVMLNYQRVAPKNDETCPVLCQDGIGSEDAAKPNPASPDQRTREPRGGFNMCVFPNGNFPSGKSATWGIQREYPLVNVYITMENHHFQWKTPLFPWLCSIVLLNYQRVKTHKIPINHHLLWFSYGFPGTMSICLGSWSNSKWCLHFAADLYISSLHRFHPLVIQHSYIIWLVVWNIFHILGIIIPNWLILFREGWNHQAPTSYEWTNRYWNKS